MANLSTTTTALTACKVTANAIVTLLTSMGTSSAASAATSPNDVTCASVVAGYNSQLTKILNDLTTFNQNLSVG